MNKFNDEIKSFISEMSKNHISSGDNTTSPWFQTKKNIILIDVFIVHIRCFGNTAVMYFIYKCNVTTRK